MKRLAAVLLLAHPAAAGEPVKIPLTCADGVCMIREDLFDAMIEAHNKAIDRLNELEAKVSKVECAKTEVTEPPKIHIKPERTS